MVSALLEILKMITSAEREAGKILDEANIQCQMIRRKAERKAEEIYKRAYEEAVAETRRKCIQLQKRGMDEAEREAEILLRKAEEQRNEIRTRSEEKFDEAVNTVLNEILF